MDEFVCMPIEVVDNEPMRSLRFWRMRFLLIDRADEGASPGVTERFSTLLESLNRILAKEQGW